MPNHHPWPPRRPRVAIAKFGEAEFKVRVVNGNVQWSVLGEPDEFTNVPQFVLDAATPAVKATIANLRREPFHPLDGDRQYSGGKRREPARVQAPPPQLPTVLEVDAAREGYRRAHTLFADRSSAQWSERESERELMKQLERLYPYPTVPKVVRAVLSDGTVMFYRVVKGELQSSRNALAPNGDGWSKAQHNEDTITALFNLFQNPTQEIAS